MKEKDQVYRLALDNGSTSVIAKRGRSDALLLERTIYERVLPQLPPLAPRYYGFVADEDEEFSWLFIEDGGDDRCSLAEHGALAARWLGTLHGASAALDLARSLPERGPSHYLDHLRAGVTAILDGYGNPALSRDDRGTLRSILSICRRIESQWGAVDAMCRPLPRTLVHGDLADRNLRLRRDEGGPAIVAFDWEWAGFGVPAADVYRLALIPTDRIVSRYRSTILRYGCPVDEDALRALSFVGKGFVLIASVNWVTPHLGYHRTERATSTLRIYEPELRQWCEDLAAASSGR